MPAIVLRANHFPDKNSVSDSLKYLGETVNEKKFESPSAMFITAIKSYEHLISEQLLTTLSCEFFVIFPRLSVVLSLN